MTDNAWLDYGLGTINGEHRKRLRENTPPITVLADQCTWAFDYGRDDDGNLYYRERGDDVWHPLTSGSWV